MATYDDYLKVLKRIAIADSEIGEHIDLLKNKKESLSTEWAEQQQVNKELSVEFENLQQINNELTTKVLAKQERERILEPIRQYEAMIVTKKKEAEIKYAELIKKYEEDMKIWQEKTKMWEEEVSRREKESSEWRSQKLCPNCGGKIGLFGKTCKVCRKEVWEPRDKLAQPKEPCKPEYNEPKFDFHDLQRTYIFNGHVRIEQWRSVGTYIDIGQRRWQVLDIQNYKALLWCGSGCMASYKQIDKCLHENFSNKFSAVEKDMIEGSLFLLDGKEVLKYFGEDKYIEKVKIGGNNSLYFGSRSNPARGEWWLRSSSGLIRQESRITDKVMGPYVPFVDTPQNYGPCITESHTHDRQEKGVRPALWLKLQ